MTEEDKKELRYLIHDALEDSRYAGWAEKLYETDLERARRYENKADKSEKKLLDFIEGL